MGCGCSGAKASENIDGEWTEVPAIQLKGETDECFNARIGPQPPQPEPGAVVPKDHIVTGAIPVDCKMKVDTTFKMSEGSHPVTWDFVIKDEQGNVKTPTDLGLTYDNATGHLSGTVKDEFEKKTFTATLKARAQADIPELEIIASDPNKNSIDEKTYKIAPKKCNDEDLRLIHPNPGSVTGDQYGMRSHPIHKVAKMHQGVDFKSHGKNKIVAAGDGKVIFAGFQGAYGNLIIIEHTNSSGKVLATTKYAHLREMYVSTPQTVKAGDVIAHEGETGVLKNGKRSVTGPHLHFEVLLGGTKHVDPLKYINGSIAVETAGVEGTVDPNAEPANVQTVQNKDKGVTQEQVKAAEECKPIPLLTEPAHAEDRVPNSKPGAILPTGPCCPPGWTPPPQAQVAKQIKDVALANGATQEEARYLLKIAYLESSYNQYADNTESSALGLFQMLNSNKVPTASVWYAKIGIPSPTCEQRCDVELATKAMLQMVKMESKGYDTFHANGTVYGASGSVANNAYTQGYSSLTREQFMYMSHGQGQNGMRKGTPGGSGFLNHFKTHAPKDSVIDGYMNS